MNASDLVSHLARFAGELRAHGVPLVLSDEIDGLQALTRIDLASPDEVRIALRCALRIRQRDFAAFHALFERLWLEQGGTDEQHRKRKMEHKPPKPQSEKKETRGAAIEVESEIPQGETPSASRDALLRKRHFDSLDDRDLIEMERLLQRLAAKLATRRSRRLVPSIAHGRADPRRSLRLALSTGGELLRLPRRAHPIETPRLVVICDTSGSMDGQSRFLLAFVRALKRVARRTEVFAFNTALTRITPWLGLSRLREVLDRLAAAVPDWSGGTRIGASLEAFAQHHLNELVDSRTVVVIFSDGLDRGEPETLAEAMRKIRRRAGRVIWLNPLLSDERYQPIARGMAAALPFVDQLAPAHSLETLERLIPQLTL